LIIIQFRTDIKIWIVHWFFSTRTTNVQTRRSSIQ
jgi:hypothetical protein